MGIFDPFFPETPIDDIPDQQLLFYCMPHAEAHSAHNTDRHCILFDPLFCANVTLHRNSSRKINSNLPHLGQKCQRNPGKASEMKARGPKARDLRVALLSFIWYH
jgi:hypothetical protein